MLPSAVTASITVQHCFSQPVVLMDTDETPFALTVVLGDMSNVSSVSSVFPVWDMMEFLIWRNPIAKLGNSAIFSS